jgi:anti-sigma regulatory factor (Ser/Thr protein kinase)
MSGPIPLQAPEIVRLFSQQFSSTPHGARVARILAVCQLAQWGIPYGSALSDDAALIVSELATNAATHGRVPGRDFEVRLDLAEHTLLIAVSDTRTDRLPPEPETLTPPPPAAGCGYGLHLVDSLAARWGVRDRACGGPGKTVWAELELRW